MKKIIVAVDGLKYSTSAIKYAIKLATENDGHLVGIFLEDFTYHSFKMHEVMANSELTVCKKVLEERDEETRRQSVNRFINACSAAHLNFSVHHDRNIALQDLIHESLFADLLIVDVTETLTHYTEKTPTHFLRDLLTQVHCPVLIVPPNYSQPKKVFLLYDGEPPSVNAIKSFSYVLPSLSALDTEVLTVRSHRDNNHLPDHRLFREYVKRHFPNLASLVLIGSPEEEVLIHLKEQRHAVVVLGAYTRGLFSRMIRNSMADALMRDLNVCLFIPNPKVS